MKLFGFTFGPIHTPESVAWQLIDGLERGTLSIWPQGSVEKERDRDSVQFAFTNAPFVTPEAPGIRVGKPGSAVVGQG